MGEGGNDSAEVRISLVADDMSEAITKAVREGMQGVREEAEKAKEATGENGLVGSILKADIEFEALKKAAELVTETIHEAYEMMEMLGDAAAEAAEEQAEQERAMTGNLFLLDRGVHSMKDLHDYAADTREEMAQFGIAAGVSAEKMTDAFEQLTSRGNMGSEKAKELAEQMAVVGKVVPGGMESLAQGMAGVELGMVRARNPIVQLIAATHTLQGNAYQVAQQMQKMNPEEQMKLGTEAIEKQAAALGKFGEKAGAPLMSELKQSFESVKEGFLESMGNPMRDALVPRLVELRDFLMVHAEAINNFGHRLGEMAAHVIGYVSDAIEGIYTGIQQDWGEIKRVFDDLFGDWERAWDNARKDTTSIHKEFATMADNFAKIMEGVLAGIKAAAEVAMDANDVLHFRAPGTTQAAIQESSVMEASHNAAGPEGQKRLDESIEKYKKLAEEAGLSGDAVEAWTAQQRAYGEAVGGFADKAREEFEGHDFGAFSSYVDEAVKVQNEGAQKYAFELLEGSEDARRALVEGAGHLTGGIEAIIKAAEDLNPELAAQLKAMMHPLSKEGGVHAPANINFHNAKFDIKQDFKDQDPDRVIVTFKRDVQRAAMNRLESRFATPFGH